MFPQSIINENDAENEAVSPNWTSIDSAIIVICFLPFGVCQVKLAVSLHAANDRERSALLPANRRFPLADLMEACKTYVKASGRRMTFEWALIHGENDSREVWCSCERTRPKEGQPFVYIMRFWSCLLCFVV